MPHPLSAPPSGEIQLIVGPMFSGKTTELLRRIRRHTVAQRACSVIKYQRDVRYSVNEATTHDQQKATASGVIRLADADIGGSEVIGIDEGQFFPDLNEFCEKWANEGKVVIVAALDGTFQRKPFGRVMELVCMAESVTKLNAVCMLCQRDAAFTLRLSKETEVEVIGGADKYIAACRSCFHAAQGAK
eukprot:TRINITY_DN12512_c0_g1_i1.p2 TRINITY_DN12512_c0_g1~~TRINITY_DN12512_c0_g1_i1.p2  ORF type:complete len:188 (+),score=69.27 TRINITY_DN12512_c0_g1_i1:3-566(+)